MKKFVAIVLSLILLVSLCGCNRQIVDMKYHFDYALVKFPDGSVEKIEIQKWNDYDGEQLQIIAEDGTVYVVCSVNCVLVREG